MTHFTGKAVKILALSALSTVLMAVSVFAAEEASGVGAITGSGVRMRSEPTTSSSVVTTMDKGTAVALLDAESEDGWYHIAFAGKTGYVSADYLIKDQDGKFTTYGCLNADSVRIRSAASTESEAVNTLSEGTTFTVNGITDGWYQVTCKYGTQGYIRSDFVDLIPSLDYNSVSADSTGIVATAKKYMGTRYVYGGASPSGFDCSGFTMYVYSKYGVSLPHTATGQWQSGKGTKIYSVSSMQPGDLVFFCDPSRSLGKACSHTGIYIGNSQFIHASSSRSGGVIISTLSSGYYATYFVGGLHIL